ncbi:MAG: hypothetical protein IJP30_04765 [Clostridia bacterium]|nr:hypothetical protein [Clostridia bacterium]
MVYVDLQDFYNKAAACKRLSREEEINCAKRMKAGDEEAREQLVQSYLPMIAGHIKHAKGDLQSLGCALYCAVELEKAIDRFDFLQDSEPFLHRISWILRQGTAKYLTRQA